MWCRFVTSANATLRLTTCEEETTAMSHDYNVVIERDSEGYYVASVPSLPGCHTQARSLDELMERIREAIELCLEVAQEEVESLDFLGVRKVSIAR
jgi:predicted RNase H-like HicB family nuclease